MTQAPVSHLQLGWRVQFEHAVHGRLAGYLLDIVRSLENGRAFAIVKVEDACPSSLHSIPLDELERQNQ